MTAAGNSANNSDRLSGYSDEQLAVMSDVSRLSVPYTSELVYRYFGFIKSKASQMCPSPSSYDDFVQEGLLGFLNAVKCFDGSKESKFSSYAYSCVVNRMKTAASKLSCLSDSEEGSDSEQGENNLTPESIIISREAFSELYDTLTPMEHEIFKLYISGLSYSEIATKLDITPKSADNAVQRARKKLRSRFSGI